MSVPVMKLASSEQRNRTGFPKSCGSPHAHIDPGVVDEDVHAAEARSDDTGILRAIADTPRRNRFLCFEGFGILFGMNEISPLTLQLLQWISQRARSYAETMDAWRSNCPRLTIWEDALADGLVQIENGADGLIVSLTALGRSALDGAVPDRKQPVIKFENHSPDHSS